MSENNTITLHYQLMEGHEISASTMTTSVNAVEVIAREMAGLIAPNAKIEINVSPPKEGGYEILILIAVVKFWAKAVMPLVQHAIKEIGIGIAEEVVDSKEPYRDIGRDIGKKITSLTKATLETPIEELEKTQKDESKLKYNSAKDRAIKAKSDLFIATNSDQNVKAISFSPETEDIPRSDFQKHLLIKKRIRPAKTIRENIKATVKQAVIPREVKGKWAIEIEEVNDKRLEKPRTEHVYIGDEYFRSADHQLTVFGLPNVIVARLETEQIYENGILKQKHKTITKVYSFNKESLADVDPILDEDEDNIVKPFRLE